MTLGELIRVLERADHEHVVPIGLGNPHSYRGDYQDLAFEPEMNVTVGYMLAQARSALNTPYYGWKGGSFTMAEYTKVWLAYVGHTGEGIGPVLLSYMLGREGVL